jgi:hypothetical protein
MFSTNSTTILKRGRQKGKGKGRGFNAQHGERHNNRHANEKGKGKTSRTKDKAKGKGKDWGKGQRTKDTCSYGIVTNLETKQDFSFFLAFLGDFPNT